MGIITADGDYHLAVGQIPFPSPLNNVKSDEE